MTTNKTSVIPATRITFAILGLFNLYAVITFFFIDEGKVILYKGVVFWVIEFFHDGFMALAHGISA